ncbi:MAG TPA: ion channel, partial [Solirubrobacterales bacterium]
ERISDAYGLVLVLVLTTYVLASLLSNHGWSAVIITLSASATSVVALTSSEAHRITLNIAIPSSALSVLLAVIGAITGGHLWLNIASFIEIALLTLASLAILRRVVTSAEVGFRTILGAISVYTILGILFTFAYGTIDRLQGGVFFSETAHAKGGDFLFFSYTTLTTTGYGDLVPAGQPGRMVAGLEMMIGQIFLVTLVAGLVSLWRPGEGLRRRQERRSGKEAPVSE